MIPSATEAQVEHKLAQEQESDDTTPVVQAGPSSGIRDDATVARGRSGEVKNVTPAGPVQPAGDLRALQQPDSTVGSLNGSDDEVSADRGALVVREQEAGGSEVARPRAFSTPHAAVVVRANRSGLSVGNSPSQQSLAEEPEIQLRSIP